MDPINPTYRQETTNTPSTDLTDDDLSSLLKDVLGSDNRYTDATPLSAIPIPDGEKRPGEEMGNEEINELVGKVLGGGPSQVKENSASPPIPLPDGEKRPGEEMGDKEMDDLIQEVLGGGPSQVKENSVLPPIPLPGKTLSSELSKKISKAFNNDLNRVRVFYDRMLRNISIETYFIPNRFFSQSIKNILEIFNDSPDDIRNVLSATMGVSGFFSNEDKTLKRIEELDDQGLRVMFKELVELNKPAFKMLQDLVGDEYAFTFIKKKDIEVELVMALLSSASNNQQLVDSWISFFLDTLPSYISGLKEEEISKKFNTLFSLYFDEDQIVKIQANVTQYLISHYKLENS